jgi:hypothetical protein
MPTSASSLTQFSCDLPVQLLTSPVATTPSPFPASQRRAEALDVVAQHLVHALAIRRRFLKQH